MGQLKLSTASGGSITLDPTNTASNFTVTIPAGNGTVNTSGAVNQVPAGSASAPSIFPTGDSNTGIYFPAADTIAFTEGGTEQMRLTSTGDLQMNSGYGSVATAYGCRAWVNFNGTGTVAIRASGNVSSITDNGTGDYTLNFTNAMPDANYSISGYCLAASGGGSAYIVLGNDFPPAAGSCRVGVGDISTGARDVAFVMFQIFR